MNSQQPLYGQPVSAKLMEIYQRLLLLHRATVDDAFSLAPIDMLVFAMLSARTRHHHAQDAYDKLRNHFFDWRCVCDAPVQSIERATGSATWADKKAIYVQKALRHIRAWHGELSLDHLFAMSDMDAAASLERLPGVGRKTSSCVLLLSTLRRAVLPVDTGHRRMMTRLGLLSPSVSSDRAHAILQSLLPRHWGAREIEAYHNTIKKHEQIYCTTNEPSCGACLLQDLCPFAQARFQPQDRHKRPITVMSKSSTQAHPLQMCMLLE